MEAELKVLMISSQWPSEEHPEWVPFVVRRYQFLRQTGIEIDVFPFRGGFNLVNYARAWLDLQRVLRRHHYDVLHVEFGPSGLLTLFPRRRPVIVSFHGSDLNGVTRASTELTLRGRILKLVGQLVALSVDEVVLVSERMAQYLPKVRRSKYHLIPCGLDLEFFCPIPKDQALASLGLSADHRYVLFVSNLPNNPIKRYDLAQAAVSLLGPEYKVRMLVATAVPHDLMPSYMNAADVFVLTSSSEGSPSVVKEALACNLPVVSVDVGDVRERIGQVEGCIVCDDDRPETIAAALKQVLDSDKPIDGRSSVMDLDERHLVQEFIRVYEKALSGAQRD